MLCLAARVRYSLERAGRGSSGGTQQGGEGNPASGQSIRVLTRLAGRGARPGTLSAYILSRQFRGWTAQAGKCRTLNASHPRAGHPPPDRWQATLAEVAAALLFIPLPEQISPGPGWLPTVVVVLLLIPLTMVQEAIRRPGGWEPSPRLVRTLALLLLALIALAEAAALAMLLQQLPTIGKGKLLFEAGAIIWAINVLVFALLYWEIDGGGPGRRSLDTFEPDDFLFPQQTQEKLNRGWSPQFLDYLFLAFNTATAFSATDTMILSRQAKLCIMVQSLISLLTIALVVGRGVNIIGG